MKKWHCWRGGWADRLFLGAFAVGACINWIGATTSMSGWTGLNFLITFGVFPMFAFGVFLLYDTFYGRTAPLAKLFAIIAVAFSLLFQLILFGAHVEDVAWIEPSCLWLGPLLAWRVVRCWADSKLQAKNGASSHA